MKYFIFIITLLIKNVITQNDPGGYSYNIENNISPALALGKILNTQQQQSLNIVQGYIPPSPAPQPVPLQQEYIPPAQQSQGLNFAINNIGLSNLTPQLSSNQYIPPNQQQLNQNYNLNKNTITSPSLQSIQNQQQQQQRLNFNTILQPLQQHQQQQQQIYQNNVLSPQQYQTNHNSPTINLSPSINNGVISPSLLGGGHQQQQQQQQNEKQIYVHLPPPSPQEYQGYQQHLPQLPPRKHYKIILVKSPTPPTPPPIIVPQPVEEKTLVYVLVKKPDPPTPEELQAIQQQQLIKSSKPEVYFIKYKTNKENGGNGNNHNDGNNIKVQPSNETADRNGNESGGGDITSPDIDIRSVSDNGKARIFPNGITVPQNLVDNTSSKPKSPAIYDTPLKTYKS